MAGTGRRAKIAARRRARPGAWKKAPRPGLSAREPDRRPPAGRPDRLPATARERPAQPDADRAYFTIDHLPRTYSGLLDDVMLRYSDDYLGEEFFNKMIAKNVLFGGGLYLNDGYMINHPVARRHLANDDSLLRVMLSNNFIRVLTRTTDPGALFDMPDSMARSGNTSFEDLIRSAEWQELRPTYRAICDNVFRNGNNRSWPAFDMSFGFAKLIGNIFDRTPSHLGLRLVTEDQLKYISDRFLALRPTEGNPRHKFEVAVRAVVNGERRQMAEMMTIANQAYHYNFGLTLTEEDTHGVAVDTTVGMAFDELLETREVSRGQLENIPLIQLPKGLSFDDGDIFRPFLDQSTKVGQAKREYLLALRRLLSSDATGIADLQKDVRLATDHYLDRIKQLFKLKMGPGATEAAFSDSIVMGLANLDAGAGGSGDDTVVATSAPTAGLAITLQAQAMSRSRQFLVERFRLVDADPEFNPSREQLITLGDIRPQIASLAFNPAKAKDFIKDIPALGQRSDAAR